MDVNRGKFAKIMDFIWIKFGKFFGGKWKLLGKIYAPFLKKTSSLFLAWNKVGKIYKSQKPRRGKFIIRLNYCHPCSTPTFFGMKLLLWTKTTLPHNCCEQSYVDERHEESRPAASDASRGTGEDDLQTEGKVVHHVVSEGRRIQISTVDLNLFLKLAGSEYW